MNPKPNLQLQPKPTPNLATSQQSTPSNNHRHRELTPTMETIKITASKTQNQTELLPSKLNSPTLTLTTHTLATTTTATTQYERRGLKKRRKRKGEAQGMRESVRKMTTN